MLVPLLGTLLSNCIVVASYPAVKRVILRGTLGELNCKSICSLYFPFSLDTVQCSQTLSNTSGQQLFMADLWMGYSSISLTTPAVTLSLSLLVVIQDVWVVLSNAPALVFGLYYVYHCHRLADKGDASLLLYMLLGGSFINFIVLLIALSLSLVKAENYAGINANFWAICVYGAGFTSLATVLRTRNSDTIDPLVLATLTFNAGLWTVYGASLSKMAMVLPNLIGLMLCAVQMFIVFKFPRTNKSGRKNEGDLDVIVEKDLRLSPGM